MTAEEEGELKGELDMDEHEKGIEELMQRYGLDKHNGGMIQWEENEEGQQEWRIDVNSVKGLSNNQVLAAREEYGYNQLTPPPQRPECIVFLEILFCDFFAMLLWVGSALCFIAYGIKLEQDNVSLQRIGQREKTKKNVAFLTIICCSPFRSYTLASCLLSWLPSPASSVISKRRKHLT